MTKRKQFWIGLLLTWAPWLPVLAFTASEISRQKAAGLGVVAGGHSVARVGLLIPIAALVALLLLFRSFERGHWGRAAAAVISIAWDSVTLLIFAFFCWFMLTRPRF